MEYTEYVQDKPINGVSWRKTIKRKKGRKEGRSHLLQQAKYGDLVEWKQRSNRSEVVASWCKP